MRKAVVSVLGLSFVLLASSVYAQSTELKNDDVRADSEARITCGFCEMDKFGMIFYLNDFPGLSFPLELTKIKVGLAQSLPLDLRLEACTEAASGTADISYEVYIGQMSESFFSSNSIRSNPFGAWNAETLVTSGTAQVSLNVATGSSTNTPPNYNLSLSEIPITNAASFGTASHRYIRVVFDVPGDPSVSDPHCDNYGDTSSDTGLYRDDAITGDGHKSFGFVERMGIPGYWEFNEDYSGFLGIGDDQVDGDWVIRLDVQASSVPPVTDAGVPVTPDSGETDNIRQLHSITPTQGRADMPTPVVIKGRGFTEDARPFLMMGATEPTYLSDVELLDSSTIQATVPSGLEPGVYFLESENKSLAEAFEVLEPATSPCPGGGCTTGGSTAKPGTVDGGSSTSSGGSTRRPARSSRRTSDDCGCQHTLSPKGSDRAYFSLLGLFLMAMVIYRRR